MKYGSPRNWKKSSSFGRNERCTAYATARMRSTVNGVRSTGPPVAASRIVCDGGLVARKVNGSRDNAPLNAHVQAKNPKKSPA